LARAQHHQHHPRAKAVVIRGVHILAGDEDEAPWDSPDQHVACVQPLIVIPLGHSALVLGVAKASASLKAPESYGVCPGSAPHGRKGVVLALHHTLFSSLTRASAAIGSLSLVHFPIQHRRWVKVRTRRAIRVILYTGCPEEMCCVVGV
jgi:hypothetical protein